MIFIILHFDTNELGEPLFWTTAHNVAMHGWEENAGKGVLAQSYAYAKKVFSINNYLRYLYHVDGYILFGIAETTL